MENSIEKIQFFCMSNYDNLNPKLKITYHSLEKNVLEKYGINGDKEKIEKTWDAKCRTWDSKDLGNLVSAKTNGNLFELEFIPMEYKHYKGATEPIADAEVSENLRKNMKVSAVGGAIYTSDNKVLVQRRAKHLYAGGKLDSGAAGFSIVKNGKLNPLEDIKEKLKRELDLEESEYETILKSVSTSFPKDLSGFVGYKVNVNFPFYELQKRANGNFIGELISIEKPNLNNFILENYLHGEFCGDGAATLIASMDYKERDELIQEINFKGGEISICPLKWRK